MYALDFGVEKHAAIVASISTLVVSDRSDFPAPVTFSNLKPFKSRPNPPPAAFPLQLPQP